MDKIITEEQAYKLLIGWTDTESERKEIIADWKEKGYQGLSFVTIFVENGKWRKKQ